MCVNYLTQKGTDGATGVLFLYQLIQPKSHFDLTDPNGHLLNSEYSSLHDPYLRNYLNRKDIHQKLIAGRFITKDDKVSSNRFGFIL